MIYSIRYSDKAEKQLNKMDRVSREKIISYIDTKIINMYDPRNFGKPLKGNLDGLWRYRVGYYRILARIEDQIMTIIIVEVGHRKDIYK